MRAKTGVVSLETAVEEVLFDGPPPLRWGDWPRDKVEAWFAAARLYTSLPQHTLTLTIEGVWVVVIDLVLPEVWPATPWVSMTKLSNGLGCKPTVAGYQMRKQGWQWHGHSSMRRVDRVPCRSCGQQRLAKKVSPVTGLCRECGG